jgi:hypothetical protein
MQDIIEKKFSTQTIVAVVHRFRYIDRFDMVLLIRGGEIRLVIMTPGCRLNHWRLCFLPSLSASAIAMSIVAVFGWPYARHVWNSFPFCQKILVTRADVFFFPFYPGYDNS